MSIKLGLLGGLVGLVLSNGTFNAAAQTPRYFDPELRLAAPDLSGLERLRFLTSLDFPPFNFADANKKPTGMNVDLARAICDELNISAKCEIQALPWADLDAALDAKRGEAIIAGNAINAQQRETHALSKSYFKFPARFIARTGWQMDAGNDFYTSLAGKSVAVVKGSAHEALLLEHFKLINLQPMADAQAVYTAVNGGATELAFVDGVTSSFWLTSANAKNCCAFVGEPYMLEKYLGLGMAVVTRKEDEALSQAINAALKEIEEKGKYAEIFERYFPKSPFEISN